MRGAMKLGWVVTLGILLAACGSDGGGGGGDNPTSGTWAFDEGALVDDTCQFQDTPSEGDGTFLLTNHGNGTLTIDPQDGTDPFECTLTGSDFNCPARLAEEIDLAAYGLVGTIEARVSVVGSFSSDSRGSGTETASITCTGTGCASAAAYLQTTFPCGFTASFTIQHD